MRTLDVGQLQPAYTGVIIHSGQNGDGQEIDYSAGDDTGSVLEVNVPNGTPALAYALLDKLKLRGYRYQPFEADGAIVDPAIEIGDNITANNVPSIVMGIQTNHSRLMASTLKAPFDEEVNHEWKYISRSERQFKRESAYTRSRLTITEGQISAEVVRATNAETQLSSRISINATEIAARVSKTGGSSQSFGWSLTDSEWTLMSNNSTVLRATSSGIEIMGRITATSGYIGNGASGFEIGNNYIRNGMLSRDDTAHNGVYIGTDGIALGAGNFKVDSSGNLTANSGTFRGNVSAGNIQYGGSYGTFSGYGITSATIGTGSGTALTSGAVSGINWGSNFGNMASYGSGSGGYTANWVACNHLVCYSPGTISGKHIGSWVYNDNTGDAYAVNWKSKSVVTESAGYSLDREFVAFVESATTGANVAVYSYSLSGGDDDTSTLNYLGR